MRKIKDRILSIKLPSDRSAFLWGPRKSGKSYWLNKHYPQQPLIDLLQTEVFAEYISRPSLLRERFVNAKGPVLIDEVQKVPQLLDEVHWLIENRGVNFIMTGSSARKLRRGHANLLAGRAWRYFMMPLAYPEAEGIKLADIFVTGLLAPHFLSEEPLNDIRAYTADYLKEEVAAGALVRNIPSFAEFLRVASLTAGELVNYTNIANETGVSAKVVRGYFEILEDTLLGYRLYPWKKMKKRRLIGTEKFYLFDVGVANYLARRTPQPGTPEFGHSMEQYICMELKAYQSYKQPDLEISFWRTSTGFEVDFILGAMETAVEVKSSPRISDHHLKGLRALREEHKVRKTVLVCLEKQPRITHDGIKILPWREFLSSLWAGDLI